MPKFANTVPTEQETRTITELAKYQKIFAPDAVLGRIGTHGERISRAMVGSNLGGRLWSSSRDLDDSLTLLRSWLVDFQMVHK